MREFRPYLYLRMDEYESECPYAYINNFGKYAACDIKGYTVKDGKESLNWNQHFCLDGNSNFRIRMADLHNERDYYILEYKDLLGRTFRQKISVSLECDAFKRNFISAFFSEEPIIKECK